MVDIERIKRYAKVESEKRLFKEKWSSNLPTALLHFK